MKALRLAVSFLTILPGGLKDEADSATFAASTKFYPLVGALLGLIISALYSVLVLILEELAASTITVIALIVLTRAFHLDALADTFDGLLGGQSKERILEIMKDSRVGSFGLAAVVSAVILKIVLVASVPDISVVGVLFVVPILSRLAASYTLATEPYARKGPGLGSLFKESSSKPTLIGATILAMGLTLPVLETSGLNVLGIVITLLTAGLFPLFYNFLVRRKIGGMTGDTVGALIELDEVVLLLVMAIATQVSF